MKIGVIGIGRLGKELIKQGCYPVYGRLGDDGTVDEASQFSCVINTAAYTDVDGCEWDTMRAFNNNAIYLDSFTRGYKGRIIQISTDYVFDGCNGPYKECDAPNPIGIYGATKLLGEEAIKKRGNNDDLIVRTTILFDVESKNFVTNVLRKLGDGTQFSLPVNLVGNPTYIPELAEAIISAVHKNDYGIRNIAGRTITSRYHLGALIAEMFGYEKEVIKPVMYSGKLIRPLNGGLVVNNKYPMMKTIYESLLRFKKETEIGKDE